MKPSLVVWLALMFTTLARPALPHDGSLAGKDGAMNGPSSLKGADQLPASTTADSMRVARDFSSGLLADSSNASDSSLSKPDSVLVPSQEHYGIFHRLLEPLAATMVAGGVLLLLYLQRGH